MHTDQRGGVLVRILLGLLVLGLLTGAGFWLVQRQDQLAGRLAMAEESLIRERSARQSLETELQRARELYELVGSELSTRDEEFSKVLTRAVSGREVQVAEVRRGLEELASTVVGLREQMGEFGRVSARLEADAAAGADRLDGSIREMREELTALRSKLEDSAEGLRKQIEGLPQPVPVDRQWILELDAAQAKRLSDFERQVTDDVGWIKAEIDRLRRETDNLNHQVNRLEARR